MKYLLTLFLLIVFNLAQSQSITYNDLVVILSKSKWESVNQLLMNKGWVYFESEEEDDYRNANISWSFGKSSYDDKATGWISVSLIGDRPIVVSYQFQNKSTYNLIRTHLINAGMKQSSSEVTDKGLIVEYSNKSHLATLIIGKAEGGYGTMTTSYTVGLRKNIKVIEDYELLTTDTTVDPPTVPYTGSEKVYDNDGGFTLFNYVAGKLNGSAKMYDSNEKLVGEFTYKNNELSGPYKLYENEDLVETGQYLKGFKEGAYKRYQSGRVSIAGIYTKDVAAGIHTYYYYGDYDGYIPLKSSGLIKNDYQEGLWKDIITLNGKDVTIGYTTYIKGEKHGPFKEISDEEIIFGNYANNILDGPYKVYIDHLTKEGQVLHGDTTKAYLSEIGTYRNGDKVGIWRSYNVNRSLVSEVGHLDGFKHGVSKSYYPKENITLITSYNKGVAEAETFYVYKTEKLYSGTFVSYSDKLAPLEEAVIIIALTAMLPAIAIV